MSYDPPSPGDRDPGSGLPSEPPTTGRYPHRPSTSSPAEQPGPATPAPADQDPLQTPPPPPNPAAQPQTSATAQPQPPGATASGGPGSTSAAWYSGPLPIESLAPRETIGAAIGRTAVKAITAVVILGGALFIIPFFFFVILAAIAGAAGGAAVDDVDTARTFVAGDSDADINLVAVPVTGLILGEDRGAGGGGLFAPIDLTYGYTVKEELAKLAEDDSVDGVILEIDSPGGTIFGSKAIAEGVELYRLNSGKPVVAYVSGMSASGGVYSMAGVDEIYADHGTLIGSIGVIFGPFTTYDGVTAVDGGILGGGVTTEGGIEVEFLTAGRSKDFGNPYRPMTDEERAVLQEGLDDAYADFVGHVSKGRDITVSTIEDDLGALIFGEQQAVENGLIDKVANRDDSYELAALAAGMDDGETWRVERLESGTPSLLDLFTGRVTEAVAGEDDTPTARIEPFCLGTGTVLAFHGDPNLLCS